MDNKNLVNGDEMPLGLGMALAQNINAMEHFAALSPADKKAVINGTSQIQSKSDMQSYVNGLVEKQ